MQVRYFAKNVEIPDSIKEHIEKKMLRVEKFFDHISDAQVTLTLLRGMYIAEITVNVNGLIVRGEERSSEMRRSFDTALKNIERQVKRHKEYLVDKVRLAGRDISFDVEDIIVPVQEAEDIDNREILKKKRFSVRAMTPTEATMQMDLLGHDFFIFKNPDTGENNVVYRRRKGGYGLLEPE